MSPVTRSNSRPASARPSFPGRSNALTRCPRASSSRIRFEPMKPEAPVTKHFILADTARILWRPTGRCHKIITSGHLTWGDGCERLRALYAGKSSARKKLSRADQRELDTKIEFLEGLVRRDSHYTDALQLLGDHYTQRGRYLEGLKVDENLARLEPGNPLVFYNLACSYALTDHFERAVLALGKSDQPRLSRFQLAGQGPRPPQTPSTSGLP